MNIQTHQSLYDKDFNAWALDMAYKLKTKKFDDLDIDNLVEEVEDMSKSQRRSLESRLIALIMHLLKWQVQSEKQCGSWKGTVRQQRMKIKKLLLDMPSLKNDFDSLLQSQNVYENALIEAINETGLKEKLFPKKIPYTKEQILDDTFYPDE
jgi:hypothetical protein